MHAFIPSYEHDVRSIPRHSETPMEESALGWALATPFGRTASDNTRKASDYNTSNCARARTFVQET